MNKLTIILFSIVAFHANAQNYIPYYNLCNKADKFLYENKYDSALTSYQLAFSMVNYIHAEYCEKAFRCAIHLEKDSLIFHYGRLALTEGIPVSRLDDMQFKNCLKKNYYTIDFDSVIQYTNQYTLSRNTHYISIIDSLFSVDQKAVYNNKAMTTNYKISKLKNASKAVLDSMNLAMILNLIEKYDYPSERILTKKAVHQANIIIHHLLKKAEYQYLWPLFIEYLNAGYYLPEDFAYTYDQAYFKKNEKPLLYYKSGQYYLSVKQKAMIDSIRTTYGIKPLEATKISSSGFKTNFEQLW